MNICINIRFSNLPASHFLWRGQIYTTRDGKKKLSTMIWHAAPETGTILPVALEKTAEIWYDRPVADERRIFPQKFSTAWEEDLFRGHCFFEIFRMRNFK